MDTIILSHLSYDPKISIYFKTTEDVLDVHHNVSPSLIMFLLYPISLNSFFFKRCKNKLLMFAPNAKEELLSYSHTIEAKENLIIKINRKHMLTFNNYPNDSLHLVIGNQFIGTSHKRDMSIRFNFIENRIETRHCNINYRKISVGRINNFDLLYSICYDLNNTKFVKIYLNCTYINEYVEEIFQLINGNYFYAYDDYFRYSNDVIGNVTRRIHDYYNKRILDKQTLGLTFTKEGNLHFIAHYHMDNGQYRNIMNSSSLEEEMKVMMEDF